MVRIHLQRITQKNHTFYLMVADPRIIIKLAKYGDANALQEYQRPWNPKRVKEVAEYVAGETDLNEKEFELGQNEIKKAIGLIPNCPLLNLKKELITDTDKECYIDLPDAGECFDILDGQHRLISFSDKYNRISDSEVYEMGFVLCNNLTGTIKKEMFMVPNITQEKVDRNVMLAMMQELDLLNIKNKNHYLIIVSLSDDEASPLYGRIRLGGKKVVGGISPKTLMSIMNKSKFTDTLGKDWSSQFTRLVEYLRAWDIVYPEKKTMKTHTLNKGLGIRYMIMLGPYVKNICERKEKLWNTNNIAEILTQLRNYVTDEDGTFSSSRDTNPFSGESSTDQLAHKHGQMLSDLYNDSGFDIFG